MLEYIFITIFTLAFGYLCWRNTVGAISFLIFALPSYLIRFEAFGLPMTLLEVMILVLFLIFVIKRFLNKDKSYLEKIGLKSLRFSNYKWLIVIILTLATIAAIISTNTNSAWGIWKAYFIEPILFFIVFINSVKNKKDFNKIITALGLSALVVAVFAIYQKITGAFIYNETWFNSESRRVTSFFGYPNAVGLYLAPIVVLFCGKCWLEIKDFYNIIAQKPKTVFENLTLFFKKIFHWDKKEKKELKLQIFKKILLIVFNLAIITTGIFAIFFARSEGALIGLAAGLVFLGLLMKRLRFITLVALVSFILLFILLPGLSGYFVQKATFSDFSGNLRLIIWQETLQMLKNSPLQGAGLANYQNAILPFHHAQNIFEVYLYPHHLILNFWSELGILGLLAFVWLIFKFFINYQKVLPANKNWYKVLLCVMIVILVHGIVDVPYFKNDLSVLWWLLFGLSYLLLEQKKVFSKE